MEKIDDMTKEFEALVAEIEPLDDLDAAWSWDQFFGGVGLGFSGAGLVAAGIAIT